jgi:dienelactone hydrolase
MSDPKYTFSAYHGDEPFCFVSYAHSDSSVVFEEMQKLGSSGFRIYYDEGIHPGHAWHDELATAIENCDLFIIYLTKSSVASANCQRELNFALDKDIPVLAIHLEDVDLPSGMQLALGDRQAIVRSRFEETAFRERIFSSVSTYIAASAEASIASPAKNTPPKAKISKLVVAIYVLAILIVGGLGFAYYTQEQQQTFDYERALVEIDDLISKDRFAEAYLIIRQLDPRDDERRSEYQERIVVPGNLNIENEGVTVSFKPYSNDQVDWIPLGVTPIVEEVLLPRGVLRFQLQKDGYDSREIIASNPGPLLGNGFYLENVGRGQFAQEPVRLSKTGVIDPDWVEVMPSNQPVFISGWSRDVLGFDIIAVTPRFYVSKFEVTNKEYLEFVLAGGYTNPEYWEGLTFRDDTNLLSFDTAMSRFVDQSGRPGPSTWEFSNYAEGEAGLPVGGLSWYEAAAYARFRNLSLPTIYQWSRFAHGPLEGIYPLSGFIEKNSNFSNKAIQPARSEIGLGPWGTYHTAGNIREWVWNETGEIGLIQGSSWKSYGNYIAIQTEQRWNRSDVNGIRLVRNDPREPFDVAQLDPIDLVYDDPYTNRKPVSDDAYAAMRFQFTAPRRTPQEVTIERVVESDIWSVDEHKLVYSPEETLTIYLFNPKNVSPPYQTILYGPSGRAIQPGKTNREAITDSLATFSYILRSGRAVLLPIWSGTYERARRPETEPEARFNQDRLFALALHQDATSTLNYLESVEDYSSEKLGFLGYSFGAAWIGQLIMALDKRIETGVYVSGGIVHFRRLHPMMDIINYAPRVTQPILQLNGIYDHLFPYEQSAKRHFELLGTPDDQKKFISYNAGHIGFPENQLVHEVTDWLDEQLGPIR